MELEVQVVPRSVRGEPPVRARGITRCRERVAEHRRFARGERRRIDKLFCRPRVSSRGRDITPARGKPSRACERRDSVATMGQSLQREQMLFGRSRVVGFDGQYGRGVTRYNVRRVDGECAIGPLDPWEG